MYARHVYTKLELSLVEFIDEMKTGVYRIELFSMELRWMCCMHVYRQLKICVLTHSLLNE